MNIVTFVVVALALLGVPGTGAAAEPDAKPGAPSAPPPRPIKDILLAQPFTLAKSYRNTWSKERALVSSGLIVVLEVDPTLVVPRNAAEPVLYAGNTPVQRLNQGERSGRVIGIVPGVSDLSGSPIWFGAPGLPERAVAASVSAERARAEQEGIRPITAEKLRSVTRPLVAAEDLTALLRDHVAPIVLEYSPQEKDLAEAWRRETAKVLPKPR